MKGLCPSDEHMHAPTLARVNKNTHTHTHQREKYQLTSVEFCSKPHARLLIQACKHRLEFKKCNIMSGVKIGNIHPFPSGGASWVACTHVCTCVSVCMCVCVCVCVCSCVLTGANSASLKAFTPPERPESATSLSVRLENIRACVWADDARVSVCCAACS